MAVAVAHGRIAQRHAPATGGATLVVDVRRPLRAAISPLLFGLGVDLSPATYAPQSGATQCTPLVGAEPALTLVRIGADTADTYDWTTDDIVLRPSGSRRLASFPCSGLPHQPGATVLRVLDRVRALGISAVVVLNGEVDDPQSAAGLVRLVAQRYGLDFARRVYWEIGNGPAGWQYFGVPLGQRYQGPPLACSPDQYAALVMSYEAAIAAALGGSDPQGQWPRIVADDWIANATDQSWTSAVTAVDTQYFPYNSPDKPLSAGAIAQGVTAQRRPDAATLGGQLDDLRANLDQYQQGKDVRLFVGQWNIDASAQTANPLYSSSAQAVFVADLLVRLAQQNVAMAAWAPPLYSSTEAPLANGRPTPGFLAFAALRGLAGAALLNTAGRAGLDSLAARLPAGRVALVLVNPSERAAPLRLRLSGVATGAVHAQVRTFSPAAPDGADTALAVQPAGTSLTVPALSAMIVTVPAG